MSVFDTYNEVTIEGSFSQIEVTVDESDYRMFSGTGPAFLKTQIARIDVNVPTSWTFEVTFLATKLANDLLDPTNRHLYFGCVNAAGFCAGVFIADNGVYYTGCVDHDASGNLKTNGPIQLLPGTTGKVKEGVYYTLRIAVNADTESTYIYLTETSQLPTTSHQLLAIAPAIATNTAPTPQPDGTVWSLCGTLADPVDARIDSIALGAGLIIPNFPPVADAGKDQVVRSCTILQLDGSQSFDPEEGALSYSWRLINAPENSVYRTTVDDISTVAPYPTNKVYSVTLGELHATETIEVGDVLVISSSVYTVTGIGADGGGFYLLLDLYGITNALAAGMAVFLSQRGIKNRTTVKPTFYPDRSGVYRFDLTVFDGSYYSQPAETLVNVTDSPLPVGVVPDVSFLWNFLLSFWNMVEGKEVIETFWSAVAQVTAGELLNLWQLEYSKSLRDIQRVVNRKWLHYDLYVPEPAGDLSETTVVYSGAETIPLTAPVSVDGAYITVTTSLYEPYMLIVPSDAGTVTLEEFEDRLLSALRVLDLRFDVHRYDGVASTRFTVTAPFAFLLSGPGADALFSVSENQLLKGTAGAVAGSYMYQVERILKPLDVQSGDYLVVGGKAYTISSVETLPSDEWPSTRIIVKEPITTPASSTWYIPGRTRSAVIDFYSALISEGDLAFYSIFSVKDGALVGEIETTVLSAADNAQEGVLLVDVGPLTGVLDNAAFQLRLRGVHRRKYVPLDPLVSSVPYLQEKLVLGSEEELLHQNVDYYIEEFRGKKCFRFVTPTYTGGDDIWEGTRPPFRLWGEFNYIDNAQQIEANFGLAVDFSLEDLEASGSNLDYLSAVRGLWFAHINGPTVQNLRLGTQLLLGLPFSEEKGVIVDIDERFSAAQGKILIQDAATGGIVRSYTYPRGLSLEVNPATNKPYAVGDEVEPFSALVVGAEVLDYVSDPKWLMGYVQQRLLTEVEKFHTFLVRVDSRAFSLSSLTFVQSFVRRIKPVHTHPIFLIQAKIDSGTDITVTTEIVLKPTLYIYASPCIWYDSATEGYHRFGKFDVSPAGPPGYNVFDGNAPLYPAVYPTPETPIYFGFDKKYLCPHNDVRATTSVTMDGVFDVPTMDGLWSWDIITFSSTLGIVQATLDYFPVGDIWKVGTMEASAPITVDAIKVEANRNGIYPAQAVKLRIYKNGVFLDEIPFTFDAGLSSRVHVYPAVPIALVATDTLDFYMCTQQLTPERTPFTTVLIHAGTGYAWSYDTVPPAGTYTSSGVMLCLFANTTVDFFLTLSWTLKAFEGTWRELSTPTTILVRICTSPQSKGGSASQRLAVW